MERQREIYIEKCREMRHSRHPSPLAALREMFKADRVRERQDVVSSHAEPTALPTGGTIPLEHEEPPRVAANDSEPTGTVPPEPTICSPSGRTFPPEHVGNCPCEWAEGLARLNTMPRPNDIPTAQWLLIVKAGGVFAAKWAEKAHHLGWTTPEIFGVHAEGPTVRYGCQGLVYSMADNNSTLVEMDGSKAVFRTANGARQVKRRDYFNMDRSRLRMIYDGN